MLRDALFIARKDFKYTISAKETIFWVFIMPVVFFFFIGTVTSGFSGTRGGGKTKLALRTGPEGGGFLTDQLIVRLGERNYDVVRPDSSHAFEDYARRLAVPDGFTDSVLAGRPVTLQFAYSGSGLGADYESIRAKRAAYTLLADVVAVSTTGTPSPEALATLNSMPRTMTLDVAPAGERRRIPSGFEQAIPGIMVMFTLLVMATSGAILLVIERRQGLLRRLAYTPMTRPAVILGKWGGKAAIGFVQIAFAMIAGTVLFKMNWGPDLPMVILVMITYGSLMASIGVVLGSLARSEGQAVAIGVIAANVLAALGGCWWPIEITPEWMQSLQLFLPTGWAMDALHRLISFGAGPSSVVIHVAGMAAATLVMTFVATRVFRFE